MKIDNSKTEMFYEIKELKKERFIFVMMSLTFFFIIVMLLLFYPKPYVENEQENNKIEWECPILLEDGNYKFESRGYLISPSGEQLECKKSSSMSSNKN